MSTATQLIVAALLVLCGVATYLGLTGGKYRG